MRAGNRILFHGNVGDSSNMWQVAISPETWHVSGTPQRATFGTTDEAAASVTSDGRMVFISRTMGADIWSLPIEANRGKRGGPLKRVTQDAADDYDPTLSDDGATLVFRSRRAGRFGVVLEEPGTSAETVLTRMPEDHYPAVSRDGTKVAYRFDRMARCPCSSSLRAEERPSRCATIAARSRSGRRMATGFCMSRRSDPSGVGLVEDRLVAERWMAAASGLRDLQSAAVSSDGGWIAFNARTEQAGARAGVRRQGTARQASRARRTGSWSARTAMRPAGRRTRACCTSGRIATARRACGRSASIRRRSGRPAMPLSIQHFHSRGLSWKNLYLGAPDIAVARDKIVFNLGEHTGNMTLRDWNETAGAAAATREILGPAMTCIVGNVRTLVCLVSG